jgi:hypothetical protein
MDHAFFFALAYTSLVMHGLSLFLPHPLESANGHKQLRLVPPVKALHDQRSIKVRGTSVRSTGIRSRAGL